jgi:hypothetical protein
MKSTAGLALLGLLCIPAWVGAQEPPVAVADPVAADPVAAEPVAVDSSVPAQDSVVIRERTPKDGDEPAATDVTLDLGTRFRVGVGVVGPLGATGRVSLLHGLGADVRDDGTRVKALCAVPIPHCAKGFLLQAEAGTGGGKLSLGLGAYAKVHEDSFKGSVGAAFRLAVARTWGDPMGTDPGLTYLGPELDLSIVHVNVTLGTLFRVAGHTGASVLFSWGLGFGN